MKFYCQSTDGKPNKDSPCKLNGPFHLAIDQQDRIWITNAIGDTVTRFPGKRSEQSRGVSHRRRQRQGHGDRQQWQRLDYQHGGLRIDSGNKLRLLALKLRGGPLSAIDRVVVKDLGVSSRLGKRLDVAP